MVKETKLYDLLGVSSSANDQEIKKAYRKQALKYHPDKPTGNEEKFKQISELFDILSNADKREVYDQYGLEAARGNAPAGGNPFAGAGGAGGGPGMNFNFGGMNGGGGHQFSSADAFNIFSQFGGFGGGDSDPFSQFGGSGFGGGNSGFGGGMPGGFQQQRRREPEVVQMKLPCTLEELYSGKLKKMKVSSKGPHGTTDSKILEIDVKPGWKAGTAVSFPNQGDYQSDGQRQTIKFVVDEKPHPVFTREDLDLKMQLPLTFKESLLGFNKEITTIDGRKIQLHKTQPVQPGQITRYPELGMPIRKNGQLVGRGDLIVSFKVDYPLTLSPNQRDLIQNYF